MKALLSIIFCALLVLPGNAFSQNNDTIKKTPDVLIGELTPDFSGISLTGTIWDNEKLKEKVVLLNFWFIGCPPCMKEIEYFNNLHKDYQNSDFVMLSIAPQVKEDLILFNDTTQQSVPATLRDYFKAETINYEVIPACDSKKHDDPNKVGVECEKITKDFYVDGYPTTFLIDKTGIIRYVMSGFVNTDTGGQAIVDDFKKVIDELLRE